MVAPRLVEAGFTVICPDLRGHGRSTSPAPTQDCSAHLKRAVAADMAQMMTALGYERFHLVGHDRGSYVALSLALDHEQRIDHLALLDCTPSREHLARADARFANMWWHWFFLARPESPERVITADVDSCYCGDPETMGAANYAEWREAINDPRVVLATLEDYRAGLTIDRGHEEADKATGRRLEVHLLQLWSLRDDLDELYGDPRVFWKDWAGAVSGRGSPTGHAAEATVASLRT
ncbi:alpha/beta fold hydrolase [Clavibacter sp. VKM Ac-2873]|uniref:alpha/beta fold hydrolase n=1 Tax=Clavibacter sp. VKM Ac-2873 TaxID=2783813 RepID=UPI00351C163D